MKREYSKFRIAGVVLGLCVSGLVLVAGFILVLYWFPLPESLSRNQYSTVLYASDNILLAARIAEDEQWRFPPVENLPEKYITSLLLFEDRRFYRHPGIDVLAIVRAINNNISKRRVVSGASTITMQLARMLSGDQKRTYWQKFKEMLLAFQLEMHFSKDEILILYASHAPFGGNNVGLAAANWRYFGRDLTKMTWAEAALFAVLPNAPSSISPGKNREKLLNKRNRLLRRLYETNVLSAMDLKLSKLEPLPGKPKTLPNKAGHLLETLKKKYPQQFLFKSTIDSNLQNQINAISDNHMRNLGRKNINNLSVLVLDNFAMKVLAYQGNHVFNGNAAYSPSVDIIQRPRSSGSLFKPFLYSSMLQKGDITPETLVLDVPSYYSGYSPKNYDRTYRGVVSAKQALIKSLNVPSVRLLQEYGVSIFKQDLLDVGLSTLFRSTDEYGLSLILGGAETTLWDITNAYAGLSLSAYGRGEEFHQASFLQDQNLLQNKKILQNQKSEISVFPISQGASWLTLEALTQVRRPGVAAAWEEFSSSQQIAWKTGTSHGWHDAWAVGSNGRYTVGVWTGNANGEEGRDLTGSKAAAPVMLDVFRLLPSETWPRKPYHALKTYSLCKDDGYLPSDGCEVHPVYVPRDADFTKTSPFQQRVHLGRETNQRVHSGCESISRMASRSYFVLPPVAEYYYQKIQPNHQALPPWRMDCLDNLPTAMNDLPMQLEYPVEGARIKIPVELDGDLGRSIFKAQHRISNAVIYWHLNNEYLGETQYIHEKAIVANAGWHSLVLVDEKGYQLKRWFKVL